MRSALRWLLIAIGLVVGLTAVVAGVFVFMFLQFRDVLVLEIEGPGSVFEFWVDLEVYEEGDPPLIMIVRDQGSSTHRSLVHMGYAADWYAEEALNIRSTRLGDLSAVIVDDEPAKPLLIWDTNSGEFAPSGGESETSRSWKDEALNRISDELGTDVCLGYLLPYGLVCRDE